MDKEYKQNTSFSNTDSVVLIVTISLPILMTVLLIFYTLYFTQKAFKQLINLQTSIEAIFNQIKIEKIVQFEIKAPSLTPKQQTSKKFQRLTTLYEHLSSQIFKSQNSKGSIIAQISDGFKKYHYMVYQLVHTVICCKGVCFEEKPDQENQGCLCCERKQKKFAKFNVLGGKTTVTSVSYQLSFLSLWILFSLGAALLNFMNLKLSNRLIQYYILAGATLLSLAIGLFIQHFSHRKYSQAIALKITNIFIQAYEEAKTIQSQGTEGNQSRPQSQRSDQIAANSHRILKNRSLENLQQLQGVKEQTQANQQNLTALHNSQHYMVDLIQTERQSTVTKLIFSLILICFAFSISIYIIMKLSYDMKVYLMAAYVGAIVLDLVFVRNIVIFIYSFNKAVAFKIYNRFNHKPIIEEDKIPLRKNFALQNLQNPSNYEYESQQQLQNQFQDQKDFSHSYISQGASRGSVGLGQSQKHLLVCNQIVQTKQQESSDENSIENNFNSQQEIFLNQLFKSTLVNYSNLPDELIEMSKKENKFGDLSNSSNYDKMLETLCRDEQAQLMVLEIALLSFITQTYGNKCTRILKNFERREIKDFDLIDQIKQKLNLNGGQQEIMRKSMIEGDNVLYSPLKAHRQLLDEIGEEENDIEMQEYIQNQIYETNQLLPQTDQSMERQYENNRVDHNIQEEDEEEIKNDTQAIQFRLTHRERESSQQLRLRVSDTFTYANTDNDHDSQRKVESQRREIINFNPSPIISQEEEDEDIEDKNNQFYNANEIYQNNFEGDNNYQDSNNSSQIQQEDSISIIKVDPELHIEVDNHFSLPPLELKRNFIIDQQIQEQKNDNNQSFQDEEIQQDHQQINDDLQVEEADELKMESYTNLVLTEAPIESKQSLVIHDFDFQPEQKDQIIFQQTQNVDEISNLNSLQIITTQSDDQQTNLIQQNDFESFQEVKQNQEDDSESEIKLRRRRVKLPEIEQNNNHSDQQLSTIRSLQFQSQQLVEQDNTDNQVAEINLRKKKRRNNRKLSKKKQSIEVLDAQEEIQTQKDYNLMEASSHTQNLNNDFDQFQTNIPVQNQIIISDEAQFQVYHIQSQSVKNSDSINSSCKKRSDEEQIIKSIEEQNNLVKDNKSLKDDNEDDFNMIEFYQFNSQTKTQDQTQNQNQFIDEENQSDNTQNIQLSNIDQSSQKSLQIQSNRPIIYQQLIPAHMTKGQKDDSQNNDDLESQISNTLQTGRVTQAESNLNYDMTESNLKNRENRFLSSNGLTSTQWEMTSNQKQQNLSNIKTSGGLGMGTQDFYPQQQMMRSATNSQAGAKPPLKSKTQRVKQMNQSGVIKPSQGQRGIIPNDIEAQRPSTQLNKFLFQNQHTQNTLFSKFQESEQSHNIINDLDDLDNLNKSDLQDDLNSQSQINFLSHSNSLKPTRPNQRAANILLQASNSEIQVLSNHKGKKRIPTKDRESSGEEINQLQSEGLGEVRRSRMVGQAAYQSESHNNNNQMLINYSFDSTNRDLSNQRERKQGQRDQLIIPSQFRSSSEQNRFKQSSPSKIQDDTFNVLENLEKSTLRERDNSQDMIYKNMNNQRGINEFILVDRLDQEKKVNPYLNSNANNLSRDKIAINTHKNQGQPLNQRAQSHENQRSTQNYLQINSQPVNIQFNPQQNSNDNQDAYQMQNNPQFKKSRDSHSVEAELKRKAYLKFSGMSQMKNPYEKQNQDSKKQQQKFQSQSNKNSNNNNQNSNNSYHSNKSNNSFNNKNTNNQGGGNLNIIM